jgi:hypothetical protein
MRLIGAMHSRLTRRSLLVSAAAAAAARAGFWERKKPAEWTGEEVRRLLTDSPWAKVMTVPLKLEKPGERGPATWKDIPGAGPTLPDSSPGGMIGSPVGGIGAPKPKLPQQAQIVVRWMSAAPVRQALARLKYPGDPGQAQRFAEREETFYVIEVLGVPSLVAYRGPELIQTELHRTSYLSTKTGRLLRPDSTYVAVQGLFLGITIRFPRHEPLSVKDGWVECGGRTEQFEFRQRFELRRMISGGRLEL